MQNQDKKVISKAYPLDDDFNKIYASGHIQFELTHVKDEPNVIIETEEWVHNQYLHVSTKSQDGIPIICTLLSVLIHI